MSDRLVADAFFRGLFSALALKGVKVISIRGDRFDRALADVFETLMSVADDRAVDVRFRIRPHPVHGDSGLVRDSIATAAQLGLISLDNPEYQDIRLRIDEDLARDLLQDVPGQGELYLTLAEEFLNNYYRSSTAENGSDEPLLTEDKPPLHA